MKDYTALLALTRKGGEESFAIICHTRTNEMSRLSQYTDKILKKMEDQAAVEGSYMSRRDRGKVRYLGYALGIVVVGLIALWLAHHP
jgi:hypothetical protein